jgi:hypothetical protein
VNVLKSNQRATTETLLERNTPRREIARKTGIDHKTLNAVVDKVRDAQRNKLHRLAAELAFQDSQRKAGIYTPDTVPIVPRASSGRYGLRPSHPLSPSD